MEGTHCALQLHKPITELCYISFYLPRGAVRGFAYKGAVTLDKSNKAFHSCYQVREGSDISSLRQQPDEQPGDIFFKQTPTKDILQELYKLTAERDRLLADLLSSNHILGVTMGNQEGKLPELAVSLAPEDDCFQSAGTWRGDPPLGSLNKRSTHGSKKPRRSGGRRESSQALPQPRERRKEHGAQEAAPRLGPDQVPLSSSFPPSPARPDLLEERGNLIPDGALLPSLRRRESCPPGLPGMLGAGPGAGSFGGASDQGTSTTEAGNDGVQGAQRQPLRARHRQTGWLENHKDHEKRPETERGRRERPAKQTSRRKPVSKAVARVQDVPAQVQRVVQTYPVGEGRIAVGPEAPAEFKPNTDLLTLPGSGAGAPSCPRVGDREQLGDPSWAGLRASTSGTSASGGSEGAVHKALLKVIESEKLEETTQGKRLGFPLSARASHSLPHSRSSGRTTGLPLSGHKTLVLDRPHRVGPDSSHPRGEEKRPSPAAPAAQGMVLNNSSPLSQSSTHQQVPPVPSPPSPKLPSTQPHHRILRLLSPPGEKEAALHDSSARKSGAISGSLAADTLEPSSSTEVPETTGANSASLGASQPQLVPEESLEKSLGPEKNTAGLRLHSPPG